MPTIIQVNSEGFQNHERLLVVYFEDPVEQIYYVRNPKHSIRKSSPAYYRIEKKKVEFSIKMKVLPICKHCGKTMKITKVEPYIHENYRMTFHCQNNQCGKSVQTIYYENIVGEEFI